MRPFSLSPCVASRSRTFTVLLACCLAAGTATSVLAQNSKPDATWSADEGVRVSNEIQKKLGRLTNYGVFDWITFGDHGKTVVLKGFASRPALQRDAEQAVKSVPSVEAVDNQIQVLPLSNNDDRIRAGVYTNIYTRPSLRKYNANAGSIRQAIGPGISGALMAGGITNSPPIGYHAIHIIVQNGHVTLYGVVLNQMDASIAGMQANATPGVFSVDNDLIVERSRSRSAEK